jgi:beta-N-acetylhexosaminidase
MLALIAVSAAGAMLALQQEPARAHDVHRKFATSSHHHAARHRAKRKTHAASRKRHISIDITPDPESKTAEAAPQRRPRKLLTRAEILNSDPQRLERLGRHLIVGFEKFSELKPLVEKRAIAGIFVSDGNVRGRTAKAVAKDIRELQDIRRAQGMPPLLVAADQEGGYVSRLSPPLKRQQSLAALISHLKKGDDPEEAVRAYAEK